MRASLIQLITRNWPIKGAALFLALMLYVAVQLQQPVTTDFELGLNVELPPGRTLQQKLPKIRAQISGKGSQILRLRTLRGDVTRRMPDTTSAATWTIRLEPSEIEAQLPKGAGDVRVLEIRPREITVALDSVARKDVRIVSLIRVVPDSGQVLHGGVSIAPTVARLVGPNKNLAAIDSVMTIATEIVNVSGSFSRTVPIDTAPLGIVRISPKQVTVTGEMGVLAERIFAGILVETGAGAATGFIITPPRVSVGVRGPQERVDALTRDSVRVVAHITGSAAGAAAGSVARLTVIAPRGIVAHATPDTVTVRRRTRRG
jgi:hypothetical protein